MEINSIKKNYLFLANIMSFGIGCMAGWPSAALLILQSNSTQLPSGPITIHEVSWVYASPTIGAIIGNFAYGWICSKYGLKVPLICAAFPQIVSPDLAADDRNNANTLLFFFITDWLATNYLCTKSILFVCI